MKNKILSVTCLLTAFLTSCYTTSSDKPVSLLRLSVIPNTVTKESLKRPFDKTTQQFGLIPKPFPKHPDSLFYLDPPGTPEPHLVATANPAEGTISIMELYTSRPSSRMLSFQKALASDIAGAGIPVKE